MKSLLRFVFSMSFLKNLFFVLLLFAVIVGGTFIFLRSYTMHGNTVSVPNLEAMTVDEAISALDAAELRHKINDSIYSEELPPGAVISQNPKPTVIDPNTGVESERQVKRNRKIYLTVNKKVPPLVEMPDLVEKHSKRSALTILEMIGLEAEVKYERSRYNNLVMKQLYKGQELKAGTKLRKGDKITLVVGKNNIGASIYPVGGPTIGKRTENNLMAQTLDMK